MPSSEKKKNSIRVLVFCRDLRWGGGVVNFTGTMLKRFSSSIISQQFVIGKRFENGISLLQLFHPLIDSVRLAYYLKKNWPDCIHLNPSLNTKSLLGNGLYLLVLALFRYRNILIFFRGWDPVVAKTIKKNFLLRQIFLFIFDRSVVTLVLGSVFKTELVGLGVDDSKVRVITTMFDGELYKNAIWKKENRIKKILFLSRFVKKTGGVETVDAFAKISKKYPDGELIMAGDGPEKGVIVKRARKLGVTHRVQFPGYLKSNNKISKLLESDIFVFPTYYGEGCPNALLEAMAAGMGLITTRVGGIPDIVHHGENGLLLDSTNPSDIATAIERLLDNQEFFCRISENNRKIAWKNYEASLVTAKIEKIYWEVTQTSK